VSVALVVVIDADNGTVADHQVEFRRELEAAKLDARSDGERIVHLIPKWSIETWILCLNGKIVTEDISYRSVRIGAAEIPSAAVSFCSWSRPSATPPVDWVPSLTAAVPEVRRL
jgi:hypothetical protein